MLSEAVETNQIYINNSQDVSTVKYASGVRLTFEVDVGLDHSCIHKREVLTGQQTADYTRENYSLFR
jgi:hypothetical protein